MAGIRGISVYQQVGSSGGNVSKGADRTGQNVQGVNQFEGTSSGSTVSGTAGTGTGASTGSVAQGVQGKTKGWSPINSGSSLIPGTTEYGTTIGNVQLSDKAKEYYNTLKSKYHNMSFIAVSKDMKGQVQKNAASYGNANKMVVLIDEEKLERMATDESYRKKYEGIIAMSQSKMDAAKNSLASSGASIKNFGMSVDSNGKENFFATVEKSTDLQKKRIEKKAAEKKEQKIKDKKKAEKKAQEERLQKAREKRSEEVKTSESDLKETEQSQDSMQSKESLQADDREYITFEANSMDELICNVRAYSYQNAVNHAMTDAERMLGSHVDFKG